MTKELKPEDYAKVLKVLDRAETFEGDLHMAIGMAYGLHRTEIRSALERCSIQDNAWVPPVAPSEEDISFLYDPRDAQLVLDSDRTL